MKKDKEKINEKKPEELIAPSEEANVLTEEKKKPVKGFPDISEFLITPDNNQEISIKRKIITVPAHKPNSQQFWRAHPTMEQIVDVLEWKEDKGELYIIHPKITPFLLEQKKRVILYLCQQRNGSPFLFPIVQPDNEGKWNSWHRSAAEAILKARTNWIRMQPDQPNSCYVLYMAEGKIPDPEWPTDMQMIDYISLAFKDKMISDLDHPLLKALRGQ